jgi:hypothetical protein
MITHFAFLVIIIVMSDAYLDELHILENPCDLYSW